MGTIDLNIYDKVEIMVFVANVKELGMKDKLICDHRIQLWVSKPYEEGSLIIPEFGQIVTARQNAAANAEQITVLPLTENLAVGRELPFTGGTTAIVTAPALANDTIVKVQPLSGSINAFNEAETDGIEQTIVLANPLAEGERVITVAPVDEWIEANRVLDFGNNIKLRSLLPIKKGETEIILQEKALYPLPAGSSADLPFYSKILSANSADDSSNANTLNERNYDSGKGTSKAVTSYNDTVQISGCYIKYDEALLRLYNLKENTAYAGCQTRLVLGENVKGGRTLAGNVWLGNNSNQRPNDQTKKIQLTLEVDGILKEANYPVVAFSK